MNTHTIIDGDIGEPTESLLKTAMMKDNMRLRSQLRKILSVVFAVSLLLPATSSAAGLAYLEQNAPTFIEKTKSSYGDMVSVAAMLHDFDQNLILAVIVVESEGNEIATSHRGAEGLMQLMPSTAKSLGVKNSKEPFQNIIAGTKYLKQLENNYGFTDPKAALVAYNMGPSRAKRWLSQYDPDNYLYVQKVMYVYDLLNAQDEERARLALEKDGHVAEGATPILTKPRMLSLAAFPMTLPASRKTEAEAE